MKPVSLDQIFPFLRWRTMVNRHTQTSDLLAGLTGAIIVLPQGIAFATIAGMPPEYGLYSAIIPAIIAALFGSSFHLISGPTTAISIVIFSKVSTLATPFTAEYIRMVLTLTLISGIFQLILGLMRLGAVVNFVSHSVVVGFTAGTAILIGTSQLGNFFGIPVSKSGPFLNIWIDLFRLLPETNLWSLAVALATLVSAALFKRSLPRWPGLLLGMICGSVTALMINGKGHGLSFVGSLPEHLPFFSVPHFSLETLRQLVPGALAVAMLGLAEAVSIARSVATVSLQRIDNNQEFIGQGLSNIVGSFFSSYASSGSFTRTGVNYSAGAKTPLAALYAALLLALVLMLIAPLTAYLPIAAMAGILLLVAYNLIDFHHIGAIYKTSGQEAVVLAVTFLSTLFLELEFAIYSGVILSLLLYLNRTSHPHFISVVPDHVGDRASFVDAQERELPECPQFKMVRIDGSIFFGAVNHISEELHNITEQNPEVGHLLIIGSGINFIDVSGCEMLFQTGHSLDLEGKKLYLSSLKEDVINILKRGKCSENLSQRVFDSKSEDIERIVPLLDKDRCRQCRLRVFLECLRMPQDEVLIVETKT